MKKTLLLLIILFSISATITAQVYKYTTTSIAYKSLNESTQRWSDWSDWESCSMLVVININKDVVNIYSNEPQEYDIIQNLGQESDNEGGEFLTWLCVNENGNRCHIRIRLLKDNSRQIYIDFSNFMFVYNIEEK